MHMARMENLKNPHAHTALIKFNFVSHSPHTRKRQWGKKFGGKNGKIPLLSFFKLVEHPEDDWKVHTTIIKNIFIRNIRFSSLLLPCIEFISWIFSFHPVMDTWARAREGRKCYMWTRRGLSRRWWFEVTKKKAAECE